MTTAEQIKSHFSKQYLLPLNTEVTASGESIPLNGAFTNLISDLRTCQASGNKMIIIGNGGSAAIASHMAEDYTKNGGIRAVTFNDAALLTCFANDYGYEHMYEKAIEFYADSGDVLIAISSSGKSSNILNAAKAAKEKGCSVITLSGFGSGNPLRTSGNMNFYVPASDYGSVEITHLALLHGILDMICEENNG